MGAIKETKHPDSPNLTVKANVYQVAQKLERCDDTDWYEYKVELWNGEDLVDEWDSRLETYNGQEGQRLSKQAAEAASKAVINEVAEHGGNTNYFDTSSLWD